MKRLWLGVMMLLFPLQWGIKYSRIDKSPSPPEFRALTSLIRLKTKLGARKSSALLESFSTPSPGELRLKRRYLAFTVPSLEEPREDVKLPSIRLLWVAHPQDFRVLTHSLQSALIHNRNPIESITVISPDPEMAEKTLHDLLPSDIEANFLHDNDYVPPKIRTRLDRTLPTHGSWATQQLIKVFGAMEHPFSSTLVIDADTVLLRDKTWLHCNGTQLLYFRSFNNQRYIKFLEHWGFKEVDMLRSFVTHHMLFQPQLLRQVISSTFGSLSLEQIVATVINSVDTLGYPEFCLEYEPYGQFLATRHSDLVAFDKYSNLGLGRPKDLTTLDETILQLRRKGHFNSVSFHSPER